MSNIDNQIAQFDLDNIPTSLWEEKCNTAIKEAIKGGFVLYEKGMLKLTPQGWQKAKASHN